MDQDSNSSVLQGQAMKDNMVEVAKQECHKESMAVDNSVVDQERKIVDTHRGMTVDTHTHKDCKAVDNYKDYMTADTHTHKDYMTADTHTHKDYMTADNCKDYMTVDTHTRKDCKTVDNCKESMSLDFPRERQVIDTRIVHYLVR